MVKVYEQKVTVERTVGVPRNCSKCGHSWIARLKVYADAKEETWISPTQEAYDKAGKTAAEKLKPLAVKKEKDVDEQVLCHVCGQFTDQAMKKHFPRGYAAGLLKKYRHTAWTSLAIFFIALIGAGIIALIGFALATYGEEVVPPIIVAIGWGAFTIFVIGAAFWNLAKFVGYIRIYPRVAEAVKAGTEDDLLRLVVECYRANNDSLAHGDMWADVPLSHVRDNVKQNGAE